MSSLQTFMAISKAFCGVQILFVPINFAFGGWLFSVILIVIASLTVGRSSILMVSCLQEFELKNYLDVAEKAYGRAGRTITGLCLALFQFIQSVVQINFILRSVKEVWALIIKNQDFRDWWLVLGIIGLLSPLAWIRKLQYFASGYIFACLLILFTLFVINGFSIQGIIYDGREAPDTFVAGNSSFKDLLTSFSFFFQSFQGIGALSPIYEQSKQHLNFTGIISFSILCITCLYIAFGFINYYYYGQISSVDAPVDIFGYLESANPLVYSSKLLFCTSLLFSYPLTIFATNQVVESYLFVRFKRNTFARKWLKNFSRVVVCALSTVLVVVLSSDGSTSSDANT